MTNYIHIALDIIIILICYFFAYLLSNLYPGSVRELFTERGATHRIEVHRSYRRLFQAIYFFCLLIFIHADLDLLDDFVFISAQIHKIVTIEGTYSKVLFLFIGATVLVLATEYAIRVLHYRRGHKARMPNLLITLLRWIILIGIFIGVSHYVYQWHIVALATSTAVLSAVAGLALKGTISDLLSGVAINSVGSIVAGQWIAMPNPRFPDSMIAGEVITTNWRETRLRSTNGHLYIIPNTTIATSIVHNMSWPDHTRRHVLTFYSSYNSAPDDVIEALVTAAKSQDAVLDVPKPPEALMKNYTEFGVRYILRFWSNTYFDKTRLEHMILTTAWHNLHAKGVRLPLASDILVKNAFTPELSAR